MKKLLLFIICLSAVQISYATHNRAGEITYEQIDPLTVRAKVTTYTKTSSSAADRDSLEVSWGDGTKQWVRRSNDRGIPLDNDVKLNYYIAEHTYAGRGSFVISFEDPNRIGGILNVNFPRSDEVKFFLSTRLTLLDQQFQGPNNSAILLQPPLDIACVGKRFVHNPNAYDPDGDSLSYEFTIPLESEGRQVPNYIFPDRLLPGANNRISLDPITGEFVWDAPPQPGEYNIAFLIKEWRNGVVINEIIRDMQVLVTTCQSNPPTIEAIEEICVVAGTEIKLDFKIGDEDINQLVRTIYTGGPFESAAGKPIITNNDQLLKPPYISTFSWKTNCDHVKKEAYQIVVRASDNSRSDSFGLSTLKTIRIKVVGPSPEILSATSTGENNIRLRWIDPYSCETTNSKNFIGFSVWRSEIPSILNFDTCNYNNISSPYRRILFNTKNKDGISYFIDDKNIQDNVTYCYRVVAEFNNIPSSGITINRIQSLPSREVCIVLKRDIPLFVKASVISTSANGSVEVRWTKPLLKDFDTLKFKGPYRTELLRKTNTDFALVPNSTKSFNGFQSWNDTSFIDNVNTTTSRIDYRLNFYYESNKIYKQVPTTSTIFLSVAPMDRENTLSWLYTTSWTNTKFYIYRKEVNGNFLLIDSVFNSNTYRDKGLSNEINYCYRVESYGTYNIENITHPILNFSQEVCSKPVDINPPCPPDFTVNTICGQDIIPKDNLVSLIKIKPTTSCGSNEVPSSYKIYFKSIQNSDYKLIATTKSPEYQHNLENNSIAGCYYITALDALNNESPRSKEFCTDNCPIYELPNTFTPNGDGANDVYEPMKNYFINAIDFKLFNEWGNLIFDTKESNIGWDGNYKNGDQAPTGSYFYTCSVFVESIDGVKKFKDLKGYINLLR